ncbi:MAG: hypothetical protein AB1717_02950 [Pseudomonadota bacterium]
MSRIWALRKGLSSGHFYKSAEAPKIGSKCSHTACMLRFFTAFCFAQVVSVVGLIEFIEPPMKNLFTIFFEAKNPS